jgi:hypothetical protein
MCFIPAPVAMWVLQTQAVRTAAQAAHTSPSCRSLEVRHRGLAKNSDRCLVTCMEPVRAALLFTRYCMFLTTTINVKKCKESAGKFSKQTAHLARRQTRRTIVDTIFGRRSARLLCATTSNQFQRTMTQLLGHKPSVQAFLSGVCSQPRVVSVSNCDGTIRSELAHQ